MQGSPAAEEAHAEASSIDRVEVAESEVQELQRKVERERQAFAQISAKLIASTTHFDLQVYCACAVQHCRGLLQLALNCAEYAFEANIAHTLHCLIRQSLAACAQLCV